MHMHTHTSTHTHFHTHTHTHTHMHTYIHTYTHTYIHTHTNNSFVQDNIGRAKGDVAYVMNAFKPEDVPVITQLALEFALFDR